MKFTKRSIPTGDGNGGVFLKLKDGESRVGVFRGEVFEFFQVWENGKSRIVEPDAPGAKSRFHLNFVTKEDGHLKAKIFNFGLTVYNQLAEISDGYDLEKTAIKITRRGTGTDTIYIILPVPPKEQPTPAQMKAIELIDLETLEHKEALHAPPQAQETDDEVPF